MRVDEPGNDDVALAADLLRVGIARLEIVVPADGGDAVAFDGDRALLDQAAARHSGRVGDDVAASDQIPSHETSYGVGSR